MSNLSKYWLEEKVPIVNGIIFPDDTAWPVHPADAPRPSLLHLRIQDDENVNLDSETQWTGISPSIEATSPELGLIAVTGECGMGGDGCIALLEGTGRRIRWLAFFDFSNPFESLTFETKHIVARNNLGETWRIPISARGEIEVHSN